MTNHLQDHGAGAEGAASTAAVPAPGRTNRDANTHTEGREASRHETSNKDVAKHPRQPLGRGRYRVKCHSLTEHGSSTLSEKGQLADFQDEYLSKALIKIQKRELNQI